MHVRMCQVPSIMLNVVDKAEHYLGTLQAAGAEQEDGMAGWEPVDKGAGKPLLSKVKECH